MSRPQERSTGVPAGAQPPQSGGNVTGSGSATGATRSGMQDQPTTTRTGTTTTYARETGSPTRASYGSGRTSMGSESMGLGGVISMVAGAIAFLAGLSAVLKQSFYHAQPGYAYRWTIYSWGWVLLILGGLLFAAGTTYLLGMSFARIAAVAVAVCTAVVGFIFLVYTPVWGVVVVALSVIAIWALLRDGGVSAGSGGGYDRSMSSGTTTRSDRM